MGCALFFAMAQKPLQEVVYLKNGNIVRGRIIEMHPEESLKIQTADGSVFICQMDEVEMLAKEPPVETRKKDGFHVGSTSGGEGTFELGYTIGNGNYKMDRFEFNAIYGYRFNPYFYMGAGTGFHYYSDMETTIMPVFADFKINFTNGKVVPYADLRAGYGFFLAKANSNAGAYLAPSLGIRFFAKRKGHLNLSVGYNCQWMKVICINWNNFSLATKRINASGISFKAGVSF